MTFPRFTFVRKDQRGFTLVELLVAIGLVGLITLGITMTISQIWTINVGASNHMIALRQVQQAGKEISKDALQAQNVIDTDSDFPLNLAWEDWEGTVNEVEYTITSDDELQRSHNIEGVRVIARYIDPDETSCAWNTTIPGVLILKVTARVGNGPQGATETRTYEVKPRPDQK